MEGSRQPSSPAAVQVLRKLAGKSVSAVFAFGATNLLSYGFFFVAGRYLAKPTFGLLNSLIGVLAIVGTLASSVQVALARTVAITPGAGGAALVTFLRRTVGYGALTLVLTLPLMPVLARALNAAYPELIATGVAAIFLVAGAGASGFLAGRTLVQTQAWASFGGAAVRLLTGWAVFFCGMGAVAGVSCYSVSQVVIVVIAYVALRRLERKTAGTAVVVHTPMDWASSLSFLFALMPLSLDQILAQTLTHDLSGDYAALATVTKMVYYASCPVVLVVYPYLLLHRADRTVRRSLMGGALLPTVGLAGVIAVPVVAQPEWAVRLLLGGRYVPIARLAAPFSLSMIAFAVSGLLVSVMIAFGARRLVVPGLAVVCLQVALFVLRHENLAMIVDNQVGVNAASLLVFGLCAAWVVHRPTSASEHTASSQADLDEKASRRLCQKQIAAKVGAATKC